MVDIGSFQVHFPLLPPPPLPGHPNSLPTLSSSPPVPLPLPEGCEPTQWRITWRERVTRGGTQESRRPTWYIMKMSHNKGCGSFSSFPCFPPPPLTPSSQCQGFQVRITMQQGQQWGCCYDLLLSHLIDYGLLFHFCIVTRLCALSITSSPLHRFSLL